MAKITIKVKVGFTSKVVVDKGVVIKFVESACACLKDPESPAHAKMLARHVLIAGLEGGLEGVVKFQLRSGIRCHIKECSDLSDITNKSPATVTCH